MQTGYHCAESAEFPEVAENNDLKKIGPKSGAGAEERRVQRIGLLSTG